MTKGLWRLQDNGTVRLYISDEAEADDRGIPAAAEGFNLESPREAQPGANTFGPLGIRAGLDIKENYTRVLRLDLFPDAKIRVNTRRTKAEIYLVERPFFNEQFLFITVVFNNQLHHAGRQSYVRPDGPYYNH